ncbi:LON peptidase substrate-binding domain-containing protein [candidate division KSB1 bacterium]|nr:LON peptidase substrate-binding domain-containing protein [candidate division KSB1 bacterium]
MPEITLPIFPLPNVVFFPKIILPLHVFEPRYKQMVREVLQKERNIGMILLQDGWQNNYFGSPSVHKIGCMGRIETYEKLPEGRFNILLNGVRRFEILRFVQDEPYRIAVVRLLEEAPFILENHQQLRAREDLMDKFMTYLQQVLGMELNDEKFDRSASLETIVNQVAAVLDIPVETKQELLELSSMDKRLTKVNDILARGLDHADKLGRIVRNMRFVPENPELN